MANEEGGRIRALTYEGKAQLQDQVANFVLKVKPEDVEDLIKKLESTTKTGATVFLSTFENDSQFGDGTYLSSTIGITTSDDAHQSKSAKRSSGGRQRRSIQQRASMENDVDNLVGPKSRKRKQ